MEAAKSAANEEMQENKHTDYIYMVTGDRLVISMNAELDHHLADEMRDVIDTIIEGANDSIQRIILISGLHKLVHTCKDVSQAAKNIEK